MTDQYQAYLKKFERLRRLSNRFSLIREVKIAIGRALREEGSFYRFQIVLRQLNVLIPVSFEVAKVLKDYLRLTDRESLVAFKKSALAFKKYHRETPFDKNAALRFFAGVLIEEDLKVLKKEPEKELLKEVLQNHLWEYYAKDKYLQEVLDFRTERIPPKGKYCSRES